MLAPPVLAFSGAEHIAVSNLALNLAIQRAEAEGKIKATEAAELRRWIAKHGKTFGDVVALVDQIKDVSPLFDTAKHQHLNCHADVDWDYLESLPGQWLRSLQAKSLNENHFQSLALSSHLAYHHAAVGEGRRKQWARALFLEAYALHHLEDFLSPGHVATARAGTADFVAIGLHDKYTDRGLQFRFARDEELVRIAKFAASQGAHDDTLELDHAAFGELANAMEQGQERRFVGDSHLHKQHVQAAFVTVLAARSIEEVLFDDSDVFADYSWTFGRRKTAGSTTASNPGMLHRAEIVGGAYKANIRPIQFFIPGELLFVTLHNAVNPDKEAMDFEGGPIGLRALTVEAVVAAIPQTSGIPLAPTLLVGYSRSVGPRPRGRFGSMRLIVPIPRTNLQLSGARLLDLDHRSRDGYGGALQAGFGFLFVGVGVEQDRNEVRGGRVNRQLVYTFDLTGILPMRTIIHGSSNFVRNIRPRRASARDSAVPLDSSPTPTPRDTPPLL